MEKLFERDALINTVLPVLTLLVIAFSMVVIAYGMESFASGVHDMFHDFRHVIGMPCH
ncbi:MAG: CbtB-domain containing protein [Proteobacteria bacterium]|nr:CbtB-domain containing protein [Pseudomonadota bacterium]